MSTIISSVAQIQETNRVMPVNGQIQNDSAKTRQTHLNKTQCTIFPQHGLSSFAANQSITETSTESAEHASEPNVPDDTACPKNDPNNTEVPITQLGYASVLSDEQLTEQSPEPQAHGLTDEQNGGCRQSDDEGVDRNQDASHPSASEYVEQPDNHLGELVFAYICIFAQIAA